MNFLIWIAILLFAVAPESKALEAQSFQKQMTIAHNLAVSQGFASGFPNFDCNARVDNGYFRTTCGTIMLTSLAAEYRMVKSTDLGNPAPGDPSALMRAVNEYAARIGMIGAYPTFGQSWQDGPLAHGVVFLKQGPVQVRSVSASELGDTPFDQWQSRVRDANRYALLRGFVAAIPNGTQTRINNVTYYGTQLFSGNPRGATYFPTPGMVYGQPDLPLPTPAAPAPNTFTDYVNLHYTPPPFFRYTAGTVFAGKILRVTNRSNYNIDLEYTDLEGRKTGQQRLGPGMFLTTPFSGLQYGGQFEAFLRGTAIPRPDDLPITVDIERAGSSTTATPPPITGPTPHPAAPSQPATTSYYRLISMRTGLALGVAEGDECRSEQPLVENQPAFAKDSQLWSFSKLGDGEWRVLSRKSGQAIDAADSYRVHQYPPYDWAAVKQTFKVNRGANGFILTSLWNRLVIASQNSASTAGTPVTQAVPDSFDSTYSQFWRLEPAVDFPAVIFRPGLAPAPCSIAPR